VDYHQELLEELQRNLRTPNLVQVHNDGMTLAGIADRSIDYVFSFGVLVHLDLEIRDSYLRETERVLCDDGVAVIQYSEKAKPAAAENAGFADNTASHMRSRVIAAGNLIIEENVTLISHSNIIVFRANRDALAQWVPEA
jgi:hypothetical protein